MKLNTTQKVLLGLAIGGGIAYFLDKKRKGATSDVAQKTITPSGKLESAENPTTREGKIEYILENASATATEEKSGFSGERFQYNPMIGYATPTGTIGVTDSGAEMILPREGNLAQEIFFNADGSGDPTVGAEAILKGMTNEEIDLAYQMVKAKKNNPDLPASAIANKLGWGDGAKATFVKVILPRIQDLKALKKSPNWKEKWAERKARLKSKLAKAGAKLDKAVEKIEREGEQAWDWVAVKNRRQRDFANQVAGNGRKGGAMWGGHRNDGLPTSADAIANS